MKNKEITLILQCVIMFICAIGWFTITLMQYNNKTINTVGLIFNIVLSIGWFSIFIIRVIQWNDYRKNNK